MPDNLQTQHTKCPANYSSQKIIVKQQTQVCQKYTKCSEDNTVIVKNEWYSNNLRYKKIMKEQMLPLEQ